MSSRGNTTSELSKTWTERIDKREEEAAQKQHVHLRHLKLRGVKREKTRQDL